MLLLRQQPKSLDPFAEAVMHNTQSDNAAQLLNAKRCGLWPDCSCHGLLTHWQDKLSNEALRWSVWNVDELASAETSIFIALSCAAEHCPSRRVRTYAAMQLLNPWWDRQRLGQELTEEFCERVRATA